MVIILLNDHYSPEWSLFLRMVFRMVFVLVLVSKAVDLREQEIE